MLTNAPPQRLNDRRLWAGIANCFRPYLGTTLLVGLTLVGGNLLGLGQPLLVAGLIDRAIPAGKASGSAAPLIPYVVGLVLLPLIASLLAWGQQYLSTRVGQGILSDLRNRLFAHLQTQSLRFFTTTRAGEITARVTDDVSSVRWAVTETWPELLSNAVLVVGTLVVLFVVSWPLALAACVTLPAFLIPARQVGSWRRELATRSQERQADLLSQLQDVLNVGGFLLMRLFGRAEAEAERFRASNAEVMRLRLQLSQAGRWLNIFVSLFGAVGPAAVYCYGGWLVLRGEISVGTVVAFVAYLTNLYRPVTRLAGSYTSVQEALGIFGRIFHLLDLEPEVRDIPGAANLGTVRGEVRFEEVTFAYVPGQRPALAGVSFVARPGQLVALVGPSGAGKTTVTYLVPRFYDPQGGRILIDGIDIRRVTQTSVASQVGMVTQDTYLFHTSVRANLLYARPDATEAEVEAACRAAHIHDFIRTLPDGYDTIVGERGVKLSGGERQRLAIARALLKDPRLLILDEATSALDSTSERLIQEALGPLLQGRTTLAIAHRLSTILAADLILVLDEGQLVESGTHVELLAHNGLYARLYREQFERTRFAETETAAVAENGRSSDPEA